MRPCTMKILAGRGFEGLSTAGICITVAQVTTDFSMLNKCGSYDPRSARFEPSPTVSGRESYVYFDPLF